MPSLPDGVKGVAGGAAHEVGADLGGFKKFILRGNVVDLAVGVVIGAAFGSVVQALVKDVITPLIGIFGGGPNANGLVVYVGSAQLQVGDLVNAVISFVLIAAIVYFLVVMPVTSLMDRYKSEPKPAPTKECPECLGKIPKAARRCSHCTAQLEAPSEAVTAAMRRVAAPSGEDVADAAAEILVTRLQGRKEEDDRAAA